jgi:symplekin
MLLLVRMITRVAEPPWNDDSMDDSNQCQVVEQDFFSRQDQLRQTLCDYVMADFPSR